MSDASRPDELATRIQGVGRWTMEVAESRMLTPHMHRIRLQGSGLENFTYRPGQDVMLWIQADGARMLYRRYTIRHFHRETGSLDLDIFAHGNGGPGEHWVQTARPGDKVEVVGPRGKISLVDAPWHLFAGDETYIAATFAMLEALPAGIPAQVFLEVSGPEEEQSLAVSADVQLTWIHRGKVSPGDPARLVAVVEAAQLASSPGHAYIGAELQVARTLNRTLAARGFDGSQISSKAYWGRGRANASIGEPKENDEGR